MEDGSATAHTPHFDPPASQIKDMVVDLERVTVVSDLNTLTETGDGGADRN